jgi:integrase
MKGGREHHVPLSDAALELLKSLQKENDLVFPGRGGAPLSDMSLSAVLRRMKRGDITVHGFRSSFRVWAAEATSYPRDVAEHALAHKLGDEVEAAYQRSTLFVKRRQMMQAWTDYCAIEQGEQQGNVVAIQAA